MIATDALLVKELYSHMVYMHVFIVDFIIKTLYLYMRIRSIPPRFSSRSPNFCDSNRFYYQLNQVSILRGTLKIPLFKLDSI